MDYQTAETLEGLNVESTELIIRGDKTLSRKDIRLISHAVESCPLMDRLVISDCSLSYSQGQIILPSLASHPSLTKVDLSKNKLGGSRHINLFLSKLASKNSRIHTIDLTENQGSEITPNDIWTVAGCAAAPVVLNYAATPVLAMGAEVVNLLMFGAFGAIIGAVGKLMLVGEEIPQFKKVLAEKDTLTMLSLNYQPESFSISEIGPHTPGYKNYIGNKGTLGDFNREVAAGIMEAIRSGEISSFEDIKKLNERIPSVLYVAEEQGIRAEIVKSLVELKAKVPEEYGIKIDIDRFVTKADAQAAGISLPEPSKKRSLLSFVQGSEARPQSQALLVMSLAKQTETVPVEIPNISHTVEGFHAWSDAQLRQKLEEMRADPQQMLEWGREIFDAIRTIAVASLRSATLASSLETPMRSMADFLDEFSSAKKIVSDYAKPSRSQKLKRLFVSNADQSAKKLQTLADASGKAKRAGIILENLLPALDNMGSDISRQLMTVNEIVDAYKLVNDAICKLCRVGEVALTEWKDDAKKDIVMLAGSDQIMPNTDPFPVTVLASRLSTLRETSVQVLSYVASHHTQLTVDQKQGEGVFRLRSNVPMLVEKVATFQKQVTSLGRAGLINGAADATRSATQGERERTLLAVMETAKAIENLAGSTHDAMLSISTVGSIPMAPLTDLSPVAHGNRLGFN